MYYIYIYYLCMVNVIYSNVQYWSLKDIEGIFCLDLFILKCFIKYIFLIENMFCSSLKYVEVYIGFFLFIFECLILI